MPLTPVAPPEGAGESPRVPLARLALDAALAVPGVLGGEVDAAGVRATTDPEAGLLPGVSVISEGDGRYAVGLRLVARVVPLPELGDEVRRRVQRRARREGLEECLGTVSVEIARVLVPEEGDS